MYEIHKALVLGCKLNFLLSLKIINHSHLDQFTTCPMYMLSASPWGQSPGLTCKGDCKISQANLRKFSWGVQSGVTQQKTPLMPTLPVSHISTERENFLTIVWE